MVGIYAATIEGGAKAAASAPCAVALSSGSGFNAPGTQGWLWLIGNQPAWNEAG